LIEKENSYSDILLGNLVKSSEICFKDRRLLTEILYGTLRNKIRIDAVIHDCIDKKKKVEKYVLNVLRVSVYQLLFLDKVPDYAVINEAVNIVKGLKKSYLTGFVNAVLRKVAKNRHTYLEIPELDSVQKISQYFSFPVWLAEYLIKMWGRAEAIEFFKHSLTPAKLVVRCAYNTDCKTLERLFDEDRVRYEKLKFPAGFYTIKIDSAINELKSFKSGSFIVQSAASYIAVKILAPKKGETALDLCSAPGTKTVEISPEVGDEGCVIASDLHYRRLLKVKENISRYDLKNVYTLSCDAQKPLPFKKSFYADKILIDVPCSGLGIIRKTPEIKYKVKYDDIKRLAKIQYNILKNSSKYLKAGGKMVYSTCSLAEEENEGVVKKFLENNSDFVIEKVNDPDLIKNQMIDENGFFKTIPHKHNTQGFFAAVIVRKDKRKRNASPDKE
jgi:16S rRNA (cytosine967-C5)-methyltransferase